MDSLLSHATAAGYVADESLSSTFDAVAAGPVVVTPSHIHSHTTSPSPPVSSSRHVLTTHSPPPQAWSSIHAIEHLRTEVKRRFEHIQGQIEVLSTKMTESRLAEQRGRYRDRELIMQALQKQKDDNTAFTKQVVFTKTRDHSEEVKREEALLYKIQVSLKS